jgi:hypothetical protein
MDDPIRRIPLSLEILVCYGNGFDWLLFGSFVQNCTESAIIAGVFYYGVRHWSGGGRVQMEGRSHLLESESNITADIFEKRSTQNARKDLAAEGSRLCVAERRFPVSRTRGICT